MTTTTKFASPETAGPKAKAMIDAGKCPGLDYWATRYEADLEYQYRPCGRKITRGDLCGMHDNLRRRRIEAEEASAASRQREAERQERQVLAAGVGGALSEAIAAKFGVSVRFDPDHNGRRLIFDVESAVELFRKIEP